MISRDRASVFHLSPSSPRSHGIARGNPDLLAPDDVFDPQTGTVLHDPFCNPPAGLGADLHHGFSQNNARSRLKNATRSRGELTPPALEHMKSMAMPQQCSLVPGHAQSLVQKISLTFPGFPFTTAFAPFTAGALQAPTGGMRGAGYPPPPPPPPPPGTQHLKPAGPGQRPVRVLVLHWFVHLQVPPELHEDLVQHLMSLGRPGHALLMYLPPFAEQSAVGMQTPGALPAPVQRPLRVARSTRVLASMVPTRRSVLRRKAVCMIATEVMIISVSIVLFP